MDNPAKGVAPKGLSLDEIQNEAEKLVSLLKERETGMFSWHMLLNERLMSLHNFLCPLFGSQHTKS